jgi:GNAT superfamily N-acetyltransferase
MADGESTPVLRFAASDGDYDAFGELCRAYVAWCRDRYADLPWFVEAVFGHQALDAELKVLSARYGPPAGRTLLAVHGNVVVAGGAYRRQSATVCELKRVYVTDAARGLGLGRILTDALMASAREDGFTTVQLDTADRFTEAIALYRSLGFAHVAPYQAYPDRLMPHMVFMAREL